MLQFAIEFIVLIFALLVVISFSITYWYVSIPLAIILIIYKIGKSHQGKR